MMPTMSVDIAGCLSARCPIALKLNICCLLRLAVVTSERICG